MPSLRQYKYTLGAAGSGTDVQYLDVTGPLLAVYEATSPFLISVDAQAPIPAERGLKFRWPFSRLTFQNVTTVAINVTLLIGDGDVEDTRPQAKPLSARRSVSLLNGVSLVVTTAATALLLDPENSDRVEVIVQAATTNLLSLALCSKNLTGWGICTIAPGVTWRMFYSGPVYMFANNVTDSAFVSATYYN